MTSKEYDRNYRINMRKRGYVRLDKWCPLEYRKMIKSVIDVLSCHKESPESAVEFRAEINGLCSAIHDRFEREYNVENDKSVF